MHNLRPFNHVRYMIALGTGLALITPFLLISTGGRLGDSLVLLVASLPWAGLALHKRLAAK